MDTRFSQFDMYAGRLHVKYGQDNTLTRITLVADPINAHDVATKSYVDDQLSSGTLTAGYGIAISPENVISWDYSLGLGTIKNAVWEAAVIDIPYGGTNNTSFEDGCLTWFDVNKMRSAEYTKVSQAGVVTFMDGYFTGELEHLRLSADDTLYMTTNDAGLLINGGLTTTADVNARHLFLTLAPSETAETIALSLPTNSSTASYTLRDVSGFTLNTQAVIDNLGSHIWTYTSSGLMLRNASQITSLLTVNTAIGQDAVLSLYAGGAINSRDIFAFTTGATRTQSGSLSVSGDSIYFSASVKDVAGQIAIATTNASTTDNTTATSYFFMMPVTNSAYIGNARDPTVADETFFVDLSLSVEMIVPPEGTSGVSITDYLVVGGDSSALELIAVGDDNTLISVYNTGIKLDCPSSTSLILSVSSSSPDILIDETQFNVSGRKLVCGDLTSSSVTASGVITGTNFVATATDTFFRAQDLSIAALSANTEILSTGSLLLSSSTSGQGLTIGSSVVSNLPLNVAAEKNTFGLQTANWTSTQTALFANSTSVPVQTRTFAVGVCDTTTWSGGLAGQDTDLIVGAMDDIIFLAGMGDNGNGPSPGTLCMTINNASCTIAVPCTISSSLSVSGTATIGDLTVSSLTSSGTISGTTLTVSGTANTGDLTASSVTGSSLSISGTASTGDLTASSLTVSGTISGNVLKGATIQNSSGSLIATLDSSGPTFSLDNNQQVIVTQSSYPISSTTGSLLLKDTGGVPYKYFYGSSPRTYMSYGSDSSSGVSYVSTGPTMINTGWDGTSSSTTSATFSTSGLDVPGSFTVGSSTLNTSYTAYVNGTLGVSSSIETTRLNNSTTSALTVQSNGNIIFDVASGYSAQFTSDITSTYGLHIAGDTSLAGRLTVGSSSVNTSYTSYVNGNMGVSGALAITGDAAFTNRLTIGTSSVNSSYTGYVNGTFCVSSTLSASSLVARTSYGLGTGLYINDGSGSNYILIDPGLAGTTSFVGSAWTCNSTTFSFSGRGTFGSNVTVSSGGLNVTGGGTFDSCTVNSTVNCTGITGSSSLGTTITDTSILGITYNAKNGGHSFVGSVLATTIQNSSSLYLISTASSVNIKANSDVTVSAKAFYVTGSGTTSTSMSNFAQHTTAACWFADGGNFGNSNSSSKDITGYTFSILGQYSFYSASGGIVLLSDERVKDFMDPFDDERLDSLVSNVQILPYKRKNRMIVGNRTYIGVSAQSLNEILPEAVTETCDDDTSHDETICTQMDVIASERMVLYVDDREGKMEKGKSYAIYTWDSQNVVKVLCLSSGVIELPENTKFNGDNIFVIGEYVRLLSVNYETLCTSFIPIIQRNHKRILDLENRIAKLENA